MKKEMVQVPLRKATCTKKSVLREQPTGSLPMDCHQLNQNHEQAGKRVQQTDIKNSERNANKRNHHGRRENYFHENCAVNRFLSILPSGPESFTTVSDSKDMGWYVDSGATDHICKDRDYFTSLQKLEIPLTLYTGHGSCPVEGKGTVKLACQIKKHTKIINLYNVLYVPSFRKNLISIPKAMSKGLGACFIDSRVTIFEKTTNVPRMVGQLHQNLFRVNLAKTGKKSRGPAGEEANAADVPLPPKPSQFLADRGEHHETSPTLAPQTQQSCPVPETGTGTPSEEVVLVNELEPQKVSKPESLSYSAVVKVAKAEGRKIQPATTDVESHITRANQPKENSPIKTTKAKSKSSSVKVSALSPKHGADSNSDSVNTKVVNKSANKVNNNNSCSDPSKLKTSSLNNKHQRVNPNCGKICNEPNAYTFTPINSNTTPDLAKTSIHKPISTLTESERWHRRYGHAHYKGLGGLSKLKDVVGVGVINPPAELCQPCQLGKSTRAQFPMIPGRKSSKPLQLIHMDVWGPARVGSFKGAYYFLTMIDDFTRFATIRILHRKNEVFQLFEEYMAEVERYHNRKIVAVRTDQGLEFCAKEFLEKLKKLGIQGQRTNPYTPEMNGVAERYNRVVGESIRTLLVDTQLPHQMWAELAVSTVYLRNRFPHKVLAGRTPYTLWHNRRQNVKHLRIIGSKAFVHIPQPHQKGKLAPRAWTGVMVGYALLTRGYRIWNPDTGTVVESKHVRIDEAVNWAMGKAFSSIKPQVQSQPEESSSSEDEVVDSLDETELPTPFLDPDGDNESTTPINLPSIADNGELTESTRKMSSSSMPDLEESFEEELVGRTRELPTTEKFKSRYPGWKKECITVDNRSQIYYRSSMGVPLFNNDQVKTHCKVLDVPYISPLFNFTTRPRLLAAQPESEEEEETSPSSTKAESSQSSPEAHLTVVEPASYSQAINSPEHQQWKEAMEDELKTLHQRDVYDEVKKPAGANVLGSRWIYKVKTDEAGNPIRFRARLVAQGFKQRPGLDFDEVFSPVVNFVLVRLFYVLLVVLSGWVHRQLDVKCAYLYGELDEVNYMNPPQGFQGAAGTVWQLKKSLYGLHQSGRCWYNKLNARLGSRGFVNVLGYNCVYIYKQSVVALIYVDDIVLFANNKVSLVNAIEILRSEFDLKDIGPIEKLLGVVFETVAGDTTLNQHKLIDKLAKLFKIFPNSSTCTPLPVGVVIRGAREGEVLDEKFPYRSLIGSLLFLASRTRPDILYPVTLLSQYNVSHTSYHVKLLLRLLQYVVNTRNYKLQLSQCDSCEMYSYSDASFATCRDTRRSWGGYIILLGSVPITWHCKKQSSVSLSTMDSEFYALVDCVKQVRWLASLVQLCPMTSEYGGVPVIYSNSASAIQFTKNYIENRRSLHIETKYFFVREWHDLQYFSLAKVPTDINVADIFTKELSEGRIRLLCQSVFAKH